MDSMSRTARYVFRPATVSGLERRDVPATIGVGATSATVVGSAQLRAINVAGPADRELDFNGSGKDTHGQPVAIRGALVTYDPAAGYVRPGTYGGGTLTTTRGTYRFSVTGPVADLNAPSGVSNLAITVNRPGVAAPSRVGAVSHVRTIARGSIQLHREPVAGGGMQVTAAILLNGGAHPRG